MAARHSAVQWAKHNTAGAQTAADGSELKNFYAVEVASPAADRKTPIILYGSPGFKRWLQVPPFAFDLNGVEVQPPAGIQALLPIESPTYGNWLVGVSAEYQFFFFSPPDDYDPFTNAGADLITQPVSNAYNFTADEVERAQGRVPMATDGRYVMFITPGNSLWGFDLKERHAVAIQSPPTVDLAENLPDEQWVDVVWVDGYFFLATTGGQLFHSLVRGIEFDASADFDFASTKPDPIVGLAVFERRLYVFGTQSVEVWYNVGGTAFAFRRDDSYSYDIGCSAQETIVANDNGIFFVSTTGVVYQRNRDGMMRLSLDNVEYDIARSVMKKARGFEYSEEGHWFYILILTFPDGTEKAWAYDQVANAWHERTATDITSMISFQGRTLVARRGSSHVQDMRLEWGTDDGEGNNDLITRVAVSPVMHIEQRRGTMSSFQMDVPSLDGADPSETAQLEVSDDGKRTWMDLGEKPVGLSRLKWNQLGQFRSGRHLRLTIEARRRVEVLGAYTQIEVND